MDKKTHADLMHEIRTEHDGYTPCMEAPDLFFQPEDKLNYPDERLAKELCGRCPVAESCLEYALSNAEMHGIWGGLNVRQRESLKRKRWDRKRRALTYRQKPVV